MEIPQFRRGEVLTAAKLNALAQSIADDVAASPALHVRNTQQPGLYRNPADEPVRATGRPRIIFEESLAACAMAPGTAGVGVIPAGKGPIGDPRKWQPLCVQWQGTGGRDDKIYEVQRINQRGCLVEVCYQVGAEDPQWRAPQAPNPYKDACSTRAYGKLVGILRRDVRYSCQLPKTLSYYIEEQNPSIPPHWLVTPPAPGTDPETGGIPRNSESLLRCISPQMQTVLRLREAGGICIKAGENSNDEKLCSYVDITSGIELWPGEAKCVPGGNPDCIPPNCSIVRPGCAYGDMQVGWRTVARLTPDPSCAPGSLKSRLELEAYQPRAEMWRVFLRLKGPLLEMADASGLVDFSHLDPGSWSEGDTIMIPDMPGMWELHPISSFKDISIIPYFSRVSDNWECNIKWWWVITWILINPEMPGMVYYVRARAPRIGSGDNEYGQWQGYSISEPFANF